MNSKYQFIRIHWWLWQKTSFEQVNISMDFGLDIFVCCEGQKGHIIFWIISCKNVHCAVSSRRELWHFFQRGRSAEWLESLWHTKRGPPWLSKAASKKARKHCRVAAEEHYLLQAKGCRSRCPSARRRRRCRCRRRRRWGLRSCSQRRSCRPWDIHWL